MSAKGGKGEESGSKKGNKSKGTNPPPPPSFPQGSIQEQHELRAEEIQSSPPPPVARTGLKYTPHRSVSGPTPFAAAADQIHDQAGQFLSTILSPRTSTKSGDLLDYLPASPAHLAMPGMSPKDTLKALSLQMRSPQGAALRSLSQEIKAAVALAPDEVAGLSSQQRYDQSVQLFEAMQAELASMKQQSANQQAELTSMKQQSANQQAELTSVKQQLNDERQAHKVELESRLGLSASQPILVASSTSPSVSRQVAKAPPLPSGSGQSQTTPLVATSQDRVSFAPTVPKLKANVQPPQPNPDSSSQWLREATTAHQQRIYLEQQELEQEQQQQRAQEERDRAVAAEQRIIDQAQKRVAALQSKPLTIRVRNPASSARTVERRVAALTGDTELLQHGSIRVKDEAKSDDEEHEIQRELSQRVAVHNLFNPRNQQSVRTKDGYVKNEFVAHSSEGEDQSSSPSAPRDDPNDPDYEQTDSLTPSPSRKARSLSAKEWDEWQAFQRSKRDPPPPSGSARPIFNVVLTTPPEHGDWRDIHHLTTVFKDKHLKYIKNSNGASHLSVWECYTETQQEQIVKQLRSKSRTDDIVRDAAYFQSLSDDQLYKLLGDELGISYTTEVEHELNKVKFQGNVLDLPNWVNFSTSWEQVLRRVTSSGALQPRRKVELFRDNVPDPFVQEWLRGRRFQTWEEAYDGITIAIDDPKWMTCYIKDKEQRLSKPQPTQKQDKQDKAAPLVKPAPAGQGAAAAPRSQAPFDPLKWKNKRNEHNVNPNMTKDLPLLNKDRAPCDRCNDGTIHNWTSDMCTAQKDKNKTTIEPALSAEEFKARLQKRWDAGFFFAKPIASYASPTAQGAAVDAAQAVKRIGGAGGGKP